LEFRISRFVFRKFDQFRISNFRNEILSFAHPCSWQNIHAFNCRLCRKTNPQELSLYLVLIIIYIYMYFHYHPFLICIYINRYINKINNYVLKNYRMKIEKSSMECLSGKPCENSTFNMCIKSCFIVIDLKNSIFTKKVSYMTNLISIDSREYRESFFVLTKFVLIGQVWDKLIKFETFGLAFCDSKICNKWRIKYKHELYLICR
jgi:hypothetical protein